MTPIDIQVSSSKVSVEGQAYSLYVGEGGHKCFANRYILFYILDIKIDFIYQEVNPISWYQNFIFLFKEIHFLI